MDGVVVVMMVVYDYRFHDWRFFILGGMICEDTNRIVRQWSSFVRYTDRNRICEVVKLSFLVRSFGAIYTPFTLPVFYAPSHSPHSLHLQPLKLPHTRL